MYIYITCLRDVDVDKLEEVLQLYCIVRMSEGITTTPIRLAVVQNCLTGPRPDHPPIKGGTWPVITPLLMYNVHLWLFYTIYIKCTFSPYT